MFSAPSCSAVLMDWYAFVMSVLAVVTRLDWAETRSALINRRVENMRSHRSIARERVCKSRIPGQHV